MQQAPKGQIWELRFQVNLSGKRTRYSNSLESLKDTDGANLIRGESLRFETESTLILRAFLIFFNFPTGEKNEYT